MSINDTQISTIRKALVDFGYTVDDAYVREQTDRVLAGEEADNVIAMFIEGWLDDAGLR